MSAVVRGSGEGAALHVIGFETRTLLSAADTGGTHSLFEIVCPLEGGPPPHIHSREDETFCVLEGEIEVQLGERKMRLTAGGCVFGPRGVAHTFRSVGPRPARVLVLVMPGGFERFFERCDRELPKGVPPDVPRLVGIMEEFGMRVLA